MSRGGGRRGRGGEPRRRRQESRGRRARALIVARTFVYSCCQSIWSHECSFNKSMTDEEEPENRSEETTRNVYLPLASSCLVHGCPFVRRPSGSFGLPETRSNIFIDLCVKFLMRIDHTWAMARLAINPAVFPPGGPPPPPPDLGLRRLPRMLPAKANWSIPLFLPGVGSSPPPAPPIGKPPPCQGFIWGRLIAYRSLKNCNIISFRSLQSQLASSYVCTVMLAWEALPVWNVNSERAIGLKTTVHKVLTPDP